MQYFQNKQKQIFKITVIVPMDLLRACPDPQFLKKELTFKQFFLFMSWLFRQSVTKIKSKLWIFIISHLFYASVFSTAQYSILIWMILSNFLKPRFMKECKDDKYWILWYSICSWEDYKSGTDLDLLIVLCMYLLFICYSGRALSPKTSSTVILSSSWCNP